MSERSAVIVETNVLATANGHADQASDQCVVKCVTRLLEIHRSGLVLLDSLNLIFKEYFGYANPKGQPGPGDAFFKWLWDHQADERYCRRVTITRRSNESDDFEEFPTAGILAGFDRSDRKWVAVAIASGLNPIVINATDSDWWHHRHSFDELGIRIEFLCPELMSKGTPSKAAPKPRSRKPDGPKR